MEDNITVGESVLKAVEVSMSCWTKEELENMLEDVVNELELSEDMVYKHGQEGTAPAKLVKLVLEQKDKEIALLKMGFIKI